MNKAIPTAKHFETILLPPHGEQERVHAYFNGAPSGFFVDVGANEPEFGSQTHYLESVGWNGVLIEPQPLLAEQLRASRRASVFAVACSSPENAGRTLQLHLAGPHSSLDPELAVAGVRAGSVIDVPVSTLDQVLVEADAPIPLDLLSIDVEGHEIEVLRGFDFARWRPRLILLEDHVTNLDKHRFLNAAGYCLMQRTGLNSWYIPQANFIKPGLFGRWQILRKYYLALPFTKLREMGRRVRARPGVR